jgi:NifU-like protein involved in Fe-S cluster formation
VTGEAEDRALHVWVRFQLQVTGGTVREARFAVFGCPHTIAAASRVAELLEGRPRAELAKLDMRKVQAELGVPIEKLGKLLRIEDALAGCGRALDKDVTHGVTKDDD